jgi:hypothetical protein
VLLAVGPVPLQPASQRPLDGASLPRSAAMVALWGSCEPENHRKINVKSHGIPNKWRFLKGKSSING